MKQPSNSSSGLDQVEALSELYLHGRLQEAIDQGKVLAEQYPDNPRIPNLLGLVYSRLGREKEAAACYTRALEIKPGDAEVYNNLGISLSNLGRLEEAAVCYQNALKISPERSDTYHNLGNVFYNLGRYEDAICSFEKAVSLDEGNLLAYSVLLHLLGQVCDWGRLEKALQHNLDFIAINSDSKEPATPFCLLAINDDARLQRRIAETYVQARQKANPALGPVGISPDHDRIRIGYFSADFHDHPTMYLMAELFELHDDSRFEIHAFSYGPNKTDSMRFRLLGSVEEFHDVRLKSDVEIARLSRSLGIDIAVDLKGYTTGARPGIFSYRAAPIQVNYLGYPGTMGAPYVDYILADPILIPQALQSCYTEKIAYLPDSYQVNDTAREVSDKAVSRFDCGLPEEAFVFCCFNNSYKITPDVFDIWMRLLGRVEKSVLWLRKPKEFVAEQNLRNEAMRRGINPQRLIFADRMPLPEHLARHRLADLFLDTFNYNAHTTASDALWVGLPVLTKLGESFASRVAGSLLDAVGLPELITTSTRQYEDMALMLATQPHKLAEVKEKLEHNIATAALFDSKRFTRHIESAYSHMYNRLYEGLGPEHFYVKTQA